jgi:hypothetical protein
VITKYTLTFVVVGSYHLQSSPLMQHLCYCWNHHWNWHFGITCRMVSDHCWISRHPGNDILLDAILFPETRRNHGAKSEA